ncbi:MAG: DsbE family thiol:disulfide interchange protein [Pseudomonadota bacterium]
MSDTPAPRSGFRPWMFLPAIGAILLLSTFFAGLGRERANDLPSTLIDKPVPEFALDPLLDSKGGLATADLHEPGVKLVNIWASWCGPCRLEHPYINALAREGITIHGLNYKDEPEAAKSFLRELGDPYTRIGTDRTGRAGIEWGVYGVPETFVIDGQGRIIYKHIGPIVGDDVSTKIRPAIEQALANGDGQGDGENGG